MISGHFRRLIEHFREGQIDSTWHGIEHLCFFFSHVLIYKSLIFFAPKTKDALCNVPIDDPNDEAIISDSPS